MGKALTERSVILIVEDDFFLRMDAVDILSHAGYAAIEAGDADEAIAILETRPDILVIFTDSRVSSGTAGRPSRSSERPAWPTWGKRICPKAAALYQSLIRLRRS